VMEFPSKSNPNGEEGIEQKVPFEHMPFW